MSPALLILVLVLAAFGAWRWVRRPVESSPAQPHVRLLECGAAQPLEQDIPRRIWTYWHRGEPPLVVRRCLDNWRRHCAGWDIQLVRGEALERHVDPAELPEGFARLTPARQSDWIRLYLLLRRGGVWIDASTILTAPPEWMREAQAASRAQYVGFYIDRYTRDPARPIVDSWCMAAPPGSPFVDAWYREFRLALSMGDDAYLAGLAGHGDAQALIQGITRPAYLIVHVCAQVVLDRAGGHRLQLWRAEDTAFFLQHRSRWRRLRLYRRLLVHPAPARAPALIKLRGGERRKLEPYLAKGLYFRDSIVGRELGEPNRAP